MYFNINVDEENGKLKIELENSSQFKSKKRELKGFSVIDIPNSYIILNIETTGLSTQFDEIIEISAIKIINNKEVGVFKSLVKPSEKIDEFVTKLTGITNAMVENAPSIKDVILDFYKFIGSNVLLGFNVNFDINFLYDNLLKQHNLYLKNNFIDVYRLSRYALKDLKSHRLKHIANFYNLSKAKHNSLENCYLINEIFKKLINEFDDFEKFKNSFYSNGKRKKKKTNSKQKMKNIVADDVEIDENHILFNKKCCITGKLERFTRVQASQIIANFGGINQDNVTAETNYLIMGNNDFCSTIKDGKSSKQKKAEKLILNGQDLTIIPEDEFYELILND